MLQYTFLAAAVDATGAGSAQPSPILQFLPLILLFFVFYFLIIRPQQKKQKEHAAMLSKMEKNDEVVTAGGLHGTLVSVGDQTVGVRIADNVKVEIEKNAIQLVKKSKAS